MGLLLAGVCLLVRPPAFAQQDSSERGLPVDLTTTPGEPYDIFGTRLVFTSWYYVRPGRLDWRDSEGKSVYVSGASGPWEAHYVPMDLPWGIRLVGQPPTRVGPLLELERPWEKQGISISTVIRDGERYRAWGSCQAADGRRFACYFESQDGLTWERPSLGLVDFNGTRENNLLEKDVGTVFIDPSAPEDERYKAVADAGTYGEELQAYLRARPGDWEPRAFTRFEEKQYTASIKGAVSRDGLHWTVLTPPLVLEYSDTQIIASYDQRRRKYVMYTRYWSVGPRTADLPPDIAHSWEWVGRRAIGRSETDDFRRFPVSRPVLVPGPDMAPADVLYTNCVTTVPGAPDQYLMFPTIWHVSSDTTSIGMASSPDNEAWTFLPGTPIFDTPPFGEWDGGCVFAHPNLIELPNGDFALPYTGYLFPHKYPRGQWRYQPGYLVWPKGRLVALEAPERGEFATIAFMVPGRKLRINALTERAGSILVQVDGVDGRSFADCDPVIGDQFRTPVTWKGVDDIGRDPDQPVILRVRMEKAKLFGLEFE